MSLLDEDLKITDQLLQDADYHWIDGSQIWHKVVYIATSYGIKKIYTVMVDHPKYLDNKPYNGWRMWITVEFYSQSNNYLGTQRTQDHQITYMSDIELYIYDLLKADQLI